MAQGIVADNWSLQDISELFVEGLSAENASEIVIQNQNHIYSPIPFSAVQTEALFDFLTDLVLRDEVIVDRKFTNTWKQFNSPIFEAQELGIIREFPFLDDPAKLNATRDKIVSQLCVTDSLKMAHQENVETWAKFKQPSNGFLSSVLWGGAGMLARSYAYELGYTPHPLRRKLFLNTGFYLPASDANHILNSLINEKRLFLSKKVFGSNALYSMFVNIPPIPIRIIQESNSAGDLISCALQLRDEFKELRGWLSSFQNAITEDNLSAITEFSQLLESVAKNIDEKIGIMSKGKFSMSVGLGILKIDINGDLINQIHNQFGLRSTLNKLILDASGKAALKKYAGFFDEKNTAIGLTLDQHFSNYNG